MVDLSVSLGPLRLKHPLINASGTMELFDVAGALNPGILTDPPVAAYVPKTVTVEPRTGNPPPRVAEAAAGMVNAIGLPGEGIDVFLAQSLPRLLSLPCPLIVSIGGFSVAEYVSLASRLHEAVEQALGASWTARVGLELNISCPNVHSGCISIGTDPRETHAVVTAVRETWPGLLVAKLTPNVTDIAAIGCAAEAAGADALAAVNTYKALVIDRRTLTPYLGNLTGGLSGPAIKPLALRSVYDLYDNVRVPIIGMGGVTTVADVVEFMACGATVVAIGSAGLREPCLAGVLALSLEEELRVRDLTLGRLTGRAHGHHEARP